MLCCTSRRSCSLDVEVSASGFTKEMEKDSDWLHPAGPESEEEDDEEEDDDTSKEETVEDKISENDPKDSIDLEEFKNAMLELEGLNSKDTETKMSNVRKEDKTKTLHPYDTETEPRVENEDETEGAEEELNEADDQCPELTRLSTFNKDFKPFR